MDEGHVRETNIVLDQLERIRQDGLAIAADRDRLQAQVLQLKRDMVAIATQRNDAWAELTELKSVPLRELLDEAVDMLALRPSGHTGANHEIPWFTHGGISHGNLRPDCLVCQWLVRAAPPPAPTLEELRKMTPAQVNEFLASIGVEMRVRE